MKEAQQRCPFNVYQNLTKVLQEEMMKRNVMRNMTQEQVSQSTDMDLKKFLSEHQKQQNLFLEKLWEKKTVESSVPKTTKLMKMSRPPVWTKEMTLETYKIQIQRWKEKEKEVPETEKFHEVLESLKTNKDIKGIHRFLNDEITEKLTKTTDQTVNKILSSLDAKFGRTELEKMEKLWNDILSFKVTSDEDGEEVVSKMKKLASDIVDKIEIQTKYPKFIGAFLFQVMKSGKYLSSFEEQTLRNELKNNDDETINRFITKLTELKIEGKRTKDAVDAYYMGKESVAR